MKLTRKQLRSIITEAMKGYVPPPYDDPYFEELRGSMSPEELKALQKLSKRGEYRQALELGHDPLIPMDHGVETLQAIPDLAKFGFDTVENTRQASRYTNYDDILRHVASELSKVSGQSVAVNDLLGSYDGGFGPDHPGRTFYWWDLRYGLEYSLGSNKQNRSSIVGHRVKPRHGSGKSRPIDIRVGCCIDPKKDLHNIVTDDFKGMSVAFVSDMGYNAIFIIDPVDIVYRGKLKRR